MSNTVATISFLLIAGVSGTALWKAFQPDTRNDELIKSKVDQTSVDALTKEVAALRAQLTAIGGTYKADAGNPDLLAWTPPATLATEEYANGLIAGMPNAPELVFAAWWQSHIDVDGDTVFGLDDRCPNTAGITTGLGIIGCPADQADDDADGASNWYDACEKTPANTAVLPGPNLDTSWVAAAEFTTIFRYAGCTPTETATKHCLTSAWVPSKTDEAILSDCGDRQTYTCALHPPEGYSNCRRN